MSLFACQQGYHAPSADTSKQNTGCACYERTVAEGSKANYLAGLKRGQDSTKQKYIDGAIVLLSIVALTEAVDEETRARAKRWLNDYANDQIDYQEY